jgi:transglutaminase-like putative cysteine protease
MTLERAGRVSGYLTLAVAAACLACAEAPLVPLLPPLLLPGLLLLVTAYLAEGRGWVLPAWGANAAALLIVVCTVAVGTSRSAAWRGPADDLALHVTLLAYLGPVLVLLTLVKLFRPKGPNDLWGLQGLGLVMVALACVLGDGGLLGSLLLTYLVCGAWHLSVFHLRREELRAGPAGAAGAPWRGPGPLSGGRWVLAAGLLALPPFLLAPRSADAPWSPLALGGPAAARRAEVGLTAVIDLNRTGTLEPDDDVVVRVEAFQDADQTVPKTDLSPRQRWRGLALDAYQGGRWEPTPPLVLSAVVADELATARAAGLPPPALPPRLRPPQRLPDLGPGQFYLNFVVVPRKAGGLVLAEPAVARKSELPVISTRPEDRTRPLFQEMPGGIVPLPQPGGRAEVHYRQVVPAAAGADLSEPVAVFRGYAALLARQPVPGLTTWTEDLARRLAARPDSGLSPDDIEPVRTPGGWAGPRHPERVARALADYLASSGDYAYSFELEHADPGLDPTLDFLTNVRRGPCTRFASGLALMLRGLGVPARVVVGYRGCEPRGEGRYYVLSSQAHAWVEALVSRPGPDGAAQWHWLALDPTPPTDGVPRPPFSLAHWWENGRNEGLTLWRDFVVDYDPETHQRAVLALLGARPWGSLGGALVAGPALALVALGLGVGYRAWGRRRRPAACRPALLPFYARLLDVLARAHGLRPLAAQTPREFAAEAGRALRGRGRVEVAGVPGRVAELFYRVAYGARPLTDDEAREVERRLDALAAAR